MKCGYGKNCKHGGEVCKEEAIKIGSRYWHKDCLCEKDGKTKIREFYYEELKLKEPAQSVNKAISRYVHDDKYEIDYIMFCLKYKSNKLNSMHGLGSILFYKPNYEEYKKMLARQTKIEYNQPINDFFEEEAVKINNKKNIMWGDIFE